MNKKTKINRILCVCATLLLSLFGVFECTLSKTTRAEEATETPSYTYVMDDLKADSAFKESDFPEDESNHKLDVFQIAESANGELFVYVYQPSNATKDIIATSINISKTTGDLLDPHNYELTLLSTSGVFDKYLVEDFTIENATVRCYEIISIYRAYDPELDDPLSTDTEQTVSEIAQEIGDRWAAMTTTSGVVYAREKAEVIEIETQIVGYIRYEDGWFIDGIDHGACDSFFVAFSAERSIDELYEASLSFTSERVLIERNVSLLGEVEEIRTSCGEVREEVTLTGDQTASNDGSGWFGKKYEWERIEKVSDFVAENEEDLNLTKGNKDDLANTQWILRFTERPSYMKIVDLNTGEGEVTGIFDVSILRLKFLSAGTQYNLGVVGNKQSGGQFAEADDNVDDALEKIGNLYNKVVNGGNKFFELLPKIGAIVGVLVLGGLGIGGVILLINGTSAIAKVFKAIWKAICAPFKLIGKLFKKNKKK